MSSAYRHPETQVRPPVVEGDHSYAGDRRQRGLGAASAHPPQEGVVEQVWRILRYRKWIVLQALILIPAVVLAWSLAQDKTYTASATLLFRQPQALPDSQQGPDDPDRVAATNTELVELGVVGDLAATRLGGGLTGEAVRQAVEIESSGQSDLAVVNATADSAKGSADIANAYADAYIDVRRRTDTRQVRAAIAIVDGNLKRLRPAERLGPEARVLRDRLESLRTQELLQTGNADIVQRAVAPAKPSGPSLRLNLALGILLAAVLGFGLAALLERIDRRVKRVEDLERLYRLPVLARIPRSRALARAGDDGVLEGLGPGPEAEAFRVLRTNLRYYSVDREIRSILVASPLPNDGKSTVARHLARTMASMNDSVVLVETDLHRGASGVLGQRQSGGLSSVLAGRDLDEALIQIPLSGDGEYAPRVLWALPSGPLPPNPSELLESARMRSVIAGLQERFDTVVLDSPALSVVSDALPLVSEVSGVVIVSGLGQTTRDAALELRQQLAILGARPLGVVANYVSSERASEHGAYYGRSSKNGSG